MTTYDIDLRDRVVPVVFARAVDRAPSATFLVFGGHEHTYADADAEVARIAARLHAAGVGQGERVLLFMDNSDTMVFTVLAVTRLGAVVVPVNTSLSGRFLRYFVDDCGAAHAIVDAALADRLTDCLGDRVGELTILVGDQVGREGAGLPAPAPVEVGFGDPAFVIYTSGTTGRSKGVIAPHAHAVSLGMALPSLHELTAQDRLLVYMPMFHASSLWTSLLGAITIGASVAVMARFSASAFWREARELGATQFVAMGGIAEILKLQDPSPADREHGIRVGYSAPLPADPAGFEERFGVALASGYGMTELPPVANSLPAAGYADRSWAGPVRTDFSEVRIVDDDDLPVPNGAVGEIVVRPLQPFTGFSGYLGKAEETVAAWTNLWFHTGDLGRLDDEGCLYFVGRKKEVLRRRGQFISPLELEELMEEFEDVDEVAALPIPSELGEDDVGVAVTVRRGSPSGPREIHSFAVANLPRYMVPRYIAVYDELPRTPTGKVEKVRLVRELLADRALLWDADKVVGRSRRP